MNLFVRGPLAAAHVVFEAIGHTSPVIVFKTRYGELLVKKQGALLQMDFPSIPPSLCKTPDILIDGLGLRPVEVLAGDDYLAVFDTELTIRTIAPDYEMLKQLNLRGVIVTAPGTDVDFVSRFFAPKLGILEDPVTGSAHCELAPYWSSRLGKNILRAKQVSKRGGSVACEVSGKRVLLAGSAITFMEGEIIL